VIIRLATVEDAASIAVIHIRSWQFAYRGLLPDAYLYGLPQTRADREARWRANLSGPSDVRCWLVEQDGAMVGFASGGLCHDPDAAPSGGEVLAIYLAPEVLGTGVGRELFGQAERDLRNRGFGPLTLWVLEGNQRARRFYEAAGWRADGAVKAQQWAGLTLQEVRYRC
jgi:GNAT superfamily N-acetyltransferase